MQINIPSRYTTIDVPSSSTAIYVKTLSGTIITLEVMSCATICGIVETEQTKPTYTQPKIFERKMKQQKLREKRQSIKKSRPQRKNMF